MGALCVLALACVVPGAQGSRYLQVGIVDDAQLFFGNGVATIADYKELHVQVVPVTLFWGGRNGVANADPVHPASPGDPAYDWSIYDQLVRRITGSGMQVLFTIDGTPSWANGGKATNVAPSDASNLRAFAEAAALRYSGKFVTHGVALPAVRDWVAWNEPNNPVFLTPQWTRVGGHYVVASAIAYAKICNAIYNGVHSTRLAGERVACGATAPRGNNEAQSGRPSVSPLAFLRAVKRYGLQTFDAWAHHPYPDRPSETPSDADPAGESVELGNIDSLISLVTRLLRAQAHLDHRVRLRDQPARPVFRCLLEAPGAVPHRVVRDRPRQPAHRHDVVVPAPRRHELERLALGAAHCGGAEEAVVRGVPADGSGSPAFVSSSR